MATVRLSDAVIPAVYESYGSINIIESTGLFQSGLIAQSELMTTIAKQGGKTGSMPFWQDIDPTVEPNMSNDDPADFSVPMKIGSATMNFRKAFLNQSWSDMDLVSELAGSDPMAHIKSRTDTYWARQYQRRLLAQVKGIIADNIANDSGDMGVNISGATAPAGIINVGAVTAATYTMGDATGGLAVAVMHSQVMARLVQQEQIVYLPNAEGRLILPTYLGYRCIMDDSMIWSGSGPTASFLTLFVGLGAFGFGGASGHLFAAGEGIPKVATELQRIPDAGNGGGQEVLYERKTVLMQPMGFNWVEGTLTEFSPTISDLVQAAHWDRAVARKAVPFAYLISKAN